MTREQGEQALALLRMLHSDIEAMRLPGDHLFGEFQTPDGSEWKTVIEWPNLSISWGFADEFLKTCE